MGTKAARAWMMALLIILPGLVGCTSTPTAQTAEVVRPVPAPTPAPPPPIVEEEEATKAAEPTRLPPVVVEATRLPPQREAEPSAEDKAGTIGMALLRLFEYAGSSRNPWTMDDNPWR